MSLFTDKVKKYLPRLQQDLGITRVQACGIFGNMGEETAGFTALQEQKPLAGRGGYGWMQWTGARRKSFEAWCKANNKALGEDETNYLYLVHETKTNESASLLALRKTTTIETATEAFMKKNLRPGVPHLDVRIRWANRALAALSPDKTSAANTAAGATVLAGTTAVVATNHPTHWIYILSATLAVAAVSWIVIYWYKHRKTTNA